jgi:excisionase family DNA binding protein
MDELLDIDAVARYLGVSTRTAYERVRRGDLPAIKIGRLWRVRVADLEAWLDRAAAPNSSAPVVKPSAAGRALLERHRGALARACQRNHVKRLDAFGSVLRDDFTPDSDIDFLVEFEPVDASGFDHPYWTLAEEIEAIFGRRIDLVMVGAVTNPYLADELERTKEVCYAA